MPLQQPEIAFQNHIADFLIQVHGYGLLEQSDITDTEHSIAEDHLWAFLEATQADTIKKLADGYGTDARDEVFRALRKEVSHTPLWMVFRHGLRVRGLEFRLYYPKPRSLQSAAAPEYGENRIPPYAPLPIEVGRMWILPPKYSQEAGDRGLSLKPIGTGPHKFVEWVKGERVVLEANKEYWRCAPPIEKVTWRAAPEASTRVAELLTGRADIVSDIPAEFQPQIESSGNRFVGIPSVRTCGPASSWWPRCRSRA